MAGRKKQAGPVNYYELPRKQLQALCKKHGFPANKTNVMMAEFLTDHLRLDDTSLPSPATVKPVEPQEIGAKMTGSSQQEADDCAQTRSESHPKGDAALEGGKSPSSSTSKFGVDYGNAEMVEDEDTRPESTGPQGKIEDQIYLQEEQTKSTKAAESGNPHASIRNGEERSPLPPRLNISERQRETESMDCSSECPNGNDSLPQTETVPPSCLPFSDAEIVVTVAADAQPKPHVELGQESPLPLSVLPRVCFYTPPKAISLLDGREKKKNLFQDLMTDGFPRVQREGIRSDGRNGNVANDDALPPLSFVDKAGSSLQLSQGSRPEMGHAIDWMDSATAEFTDDAGGAPSSIKSASSSLTPKGKFSLRSSPSIPAIFPSPRGCTHLLADPVRADIVEEWTTNVLKENKSEAGDHGLSCLGRVAKAIQVEEHVLREREDNSMAGDFVDLHERTPHFKPELQNPPEGIVQKVLSLYEVDARPQSLLSRKGSGYKCSPFWKSSRVAAELERAAKQGQARRTGILAQKRIAGNAGPEPDAANSQAFGGNTGPGPASRAIPGNEMDTTGGPSHSFPSDADSSDRRGETSDAVLDSEREGPDFKNSPQGGNLEEAEAVPDNENKRNARDDLSCGTPKDIIMGDADASDTIDECSDPAPIDIGGAVCDRQNLLGEIAASPQLPAVSSPLADQTAVAGSENGCPAETKIVIRPHSQTDRELAGDEEPTWQPPANEEAAATDLSWMSKPIRVHLRRLSPPHQKHASGRPFSASERKPEAVVNVLGQPPANEEAAATDLSWMSKPIRVHLRRLSPPHQKHASGRPFSASERKPEAVVNVLGQPAVLHTPKRLFGGAVVPIGVPFVHRTGTSAEKEKIGRIHGGGVGSGDRARSAKEAAPSSALRRTAVEDIPPPPPALLSSIVGTTAEHEEVTELYTSCDRPVEVNRTVSSGLHSANQTPARQQRSAAVDFLSSIERLGPADVEYGAGPTKLEQHFTPAARELRTHFPHSRERITSPSQSVTGFLAIDFTKVREEDGATAAQGRVDSKRRAEVTATPSGVGSRHLSAATPPCAIDSILIEGALRESDGLVMPGKENEWVKRREQHKTPLTGRSMQKSLLTGERNTAVWREQLLRQRRGMHMKTDSPDPASIQSSPLKEWTINRVL